MLLESDRMINAYFREFYSEKDVVMEERRLSENRPGSLFDEQVTARLLYRLALSLGRHRLDGRPPEVHQAGHDRLP